MDPLSIAASSTALATLAFKASSAIYTSIEATKTVDATILQFHSEVGALATSLSGIASTFRSDEVQELYASKLQSATLLMGINSLLDDCERNLECLGAMLEGISGDGKKGKLSQYLRKPKAAVRLHFKAGEIESLRHQVGSYSSATQMTLQMVGICLSINGKKKVEFLGAVLSRQLFDLSAQISNMEQKLSSQPILINLQGFNADVESDGKKQRQNMQDHVCKAEAIFRARANMRRAYLRGRISKWIPTGDVLTEEENKETAPWNHTPSRREDAGTTHDANSKHDKNIYKSNNALERDLFKARVAVAQNKLKAKEYHVAAAQFKACLANPTSHLPHDELFEIVLQLSDAYQGAQEHTKQEKLLLKYLKWTSAKLSEGQTFRLHHALGVAYLDNALFRHRHSSSQELVSAREHAEIAVKGRRRLLGSSHDAYHKSLTLLATTCRAQKDVDAADVYIHLLPPTYVNEEEGRLLHYENLALDALLKAGYKKLDKKMNKAAWKWALTSGDLTTILFMLKLCKNDADINIKYMLGKTRLQRFCMEGRKERVKVLLEAGADPNVKDFFGGSPMFDAVGKGSLGTVRLLLSKGALVEKGLDNITPLIHACDRGNVQIVQLLLENGADKTARFGRDTPLDKALKKGHREVVLILDPTYKF